MSCLGVPVVRQVTSSLIFVAGRLTRGRRDHGYDALHGEVGAYNHVHKSPRGRGRLASVALLVAVAALTSGLCVTDVPSAAAHFTRPFLHQIASAPTGQNGLQAPLPLDGDITTDSSNDLWLGTGTQYSLDKFGPVPQNEYLSSLSLSYPSVELKETATRADRIAIINATGDFIVTSETGKPYQPKVEIFDRNGNFLRRWPEFAGPNIVVDNAVDPLDPASCSMSDCTVYVSHEQDNSPQDGGNGQPAGIEKFTVNEAGAFTPVPFDEAANASEYINGNEITGLPATAGKMEPYHQLPLTVDAQGDIYAVMEVAPKFERDIAEYAPSGRFIRLFTGRNTPGIGESHEDGGFGGEPQEIAIDPISGHLLVTVIHYNYVANPNGGSTLEAFESVVDEFNTTSGQFEAQITNAGGSKLHAAYGIASDSQGSLYVVDDTERRAQEAVEPEHAIDVYGPGRYLPTVAIAGAVLREDGKATVSGTVDPENLALGACAFQYVSEAAFDVTEFADLSSGGEVPCEPSAASIPADNSNHPVQAVIDGLVSGTTYRYRLVATTAGTLGGTADSEALAFTAPHAPKIEAVYASNVSSAFVDMHAKIDPLGAATSYHFEYDTRPYSGPESHGVNIPVPDASVGAGGPSGDLVASVVQRVGGLTAGTDYHFRAVAENVIAGKMDVIYGPDVTFSTLPQVVPGLQDGRNYELVTPPNKGSSADLFSFPEVELQQFFNNDRAFASEDGEGLIFESQHATFGTFTATGANAYVFRRNKQAHEWSYRSVAPEDMGVQNVIVSVFNPKDLSVIGLVDGVGAVPSPSGQRAMDLAGPPGGTYTVLHEDAARHTLYSLPSEEVTRIVGAASDLKHVLLESNNHGLAQPIPNQVAESHTLYEWTANESSGTGGAEGMLRVASIDSEGAPFRCGAELGQAGRVTGGAHNAVSTDGSRVIFTAPDPQAADDGTGCWNTTTGSNAPQLYMRVNGGETIELSAPEAGWRPQGPRRPAIFAGASSDGSRVFFVTETELTRDDAGHDVEGAAPDPELYECEIVSEGGVYHCNLKHVSAANPSLSGGGSGNVDAQVYTVPAVAANGSAVYFTAFGALANGATAQSLLPGTGAVNLYRYDTETSVTTFVAMVNGRDYPSDQGFGAGFGMLAPEVALAADGNWYTTPDGRYLLFDSVEPITGYDTQGAQGAHCPELNSVGTAASGYCHEVYWYDSASGQLACVSCDPSGATPNSNAFFAYSTALMQRSAPPVPAMSSNGAYVFFDTADALVSTDGDKTLDVYEWHYNAQSHRGSVSLISSGRDSAPSYFLAQSAAEYDGSHVEAANVFFGTHAKLVASDTDSAGDIYDARICTVSEPCISGPPAATVQCEGSTCEHPPSAPLDATPTSLTFSGVGNIIAIKHTVRETRKQKLKRAIKACQKMKRKRERAKCVRQAHKRFGVAGTRAAYRRTNGRRG